LGVAIPSSSASSTLSPMPSYGGGACIFHQGLTHHP